MELEAKHRPELDRGFEAAGWWSRAYGELARQDRGSRPLLIKLEREGGSSSLYRGRVLSEGHPGAGLTLKYVERQLKFLLWQRGGYKVRISGADEVTEKLKGIYAAGGERGFDAEFLGEQMNRRRLEIESCREEEMGGGEESPLELGRHLEGCRIGFDLGGSDRKAAALVDGEVVYSEEIRWDPYFQRDPNYHVEGVRDSLRRAAEHLPRVDAIGGSAAGTYENNEVRAASLFRGVSSEGFEKTIRRMFIKLREEWGGIPFEVINDGEVTALAGSMWLKDGGVLGISLGTSQAAGYVDVKGKMTRWFNELAFAPVDYRENAPMDEWSGDRGCGVQYFSQQGIGRLANAAGFEFAEGMALPERLVEVQEAMRKGDRRAAAIYRSVGVYLGYAVGHYAEHYDIRHLLLLGRVMSGEGGNLIMEKAKEVLKDEFPQLSEQIRFATPTEQQKRHGQAVAAASLPKLG